MLHEKSPIADPGEGVGRASPSAEDTRSSPRASPAHRAPPVALCPGAWVRITSGSHFGRKAKVESVDRDRATISINWDVPLAIVRRITIAVERLDLLLPSGVGEVRDGRARPGAPSASAGPVPHRP